MTSLLTSLVEKEMKCTRELIRAEVSASNDKDEANRLAAEHEELEQEMEYQELQAQGLALAYRRRRSHDVQERGGGLRAGVSGADQSGSQQRHQQEHHPRRRGDSRRRGRSAWWTLQRAPPMP